MGYNLAIEYMADYEKTWMLAAFRDLNKRVLAPNGRALTEWLFLEVSTQVLVVQSADRFLCSSSSSLSQSIDCTSLCQYACVYRYSWPAAAMCCGCCLCAKGVRLQHAVGLPNKVHRCDLATFVLRRVL